jgi:hypothetical protein
LEEITEDLGLDLEDQALNPMICGLLMKLPEKDSNGDRLMRMRCLLRLCSSCAGEILQQEPTGSLSRIQVTTPPKLRFRTLLSDEAQVVHLTHYLR